MQDTGTPDNLLPLVAEGRQDAVRDCIDRYAGLVWSLARRLCPNHAEAEDAVQEIFVSLWKSAGRFDPSVGSEPTFVAMIARRRLIDRIRRVTRGPDQVSLDAAGPRQDFSSSGGGSPSEANGLQLGEECDAARAAIERLSEDQQRVIRMSVLHGLSHEKIAQATDMPLGTVKTHIRRGLIKVRQILAEEASRQEGERGTSDQTESGAGSREVAT